MLAAATARRTDTPPSTFITPATRSSRPSSPASAGPGVTRMKLVFPSRRRPRRSCAT